MCTRTHACCLGLFFVTGVTHRRAVLACKCNQNPTVHRHRDGERCWGWPRPAGRSTVRQRGALCWLGDQKSGETDLQANWNTCSQPPDFVANHFTAEPAISDREGNGPDVVVRFGHSHGQSQGRNYEVYDQPCHAGQRREIHRRDGQRNTHEYQGIPRRQARPDSHDQS